MKKTVIIKSGLTLILMSAVMLLSFIACTPKVQQQYYVDNSTESDDNGEENDSINTAVADSSLLTFLAILVFLCSWLIVIYQTQIGVVTVLLSVTVGVMV